ncbi:thioredoxin domain-containing protein [Nonomuraea sp. SMC257]|uniref:Thioredoxin domain-containing protein n=2 Tax=Nonomuraea montanisoli TaxID=2741721 RepID=A0A7Y6M264_9ACTN|nr:thioredoxin domain-containing protein [Nonomuraea montanisoli]
MSKGERMKTAREKIKQQQAAERQREQRRRVVTYAAVGVVALAAIGGGWLYAASRSQSEEAAAGDQAPVTVQSDGSVVMAKAGVEKPVLDIYEDFQCPACKQLETVSGQTFKNLAAEGKAKVVYHPISIFQREPTRGNSLRAGAAARCVADGRQWLAFHDLLYKNQPSETVEGFKINDLVGWGKEAGVTSPDFEQCVTSQKHAQAQLSYADKVIKAQKIEGTPTVKLNGVDLEGNVAFTPQQLRDQVTKAAK